MMRFFWYLNLVLGERRTRLSWRKIGGDGVEWLGGWVVGGGSVLSALYLFLYVRRDDEICSLSVFDT